MDDLSLVEAMANEVEEQAVKFRQESIAEETLSADFPLPYVPWSELHDGIGERASVEFGYSARLETGDLGFMPRRNIEVRKSVRKPDQIEGPERSASPAKMPAGMARPFCHIPHAKRRNVTARMVPLA